MELTWIRLNGFGRFVQKSRSKLELNGKLVAIVGPNEAGKTTLLNAIAEIGSRSKIETRYLHSQTRGRNPEIKTPVIEAGFFLDDTDRAEIGKVFPSDSCRWLVVKKFENGHLELRLEPELVRDQSSRLKLAADIDRVLNRKSLRFCFDNFEGELEDELRGSLDLLQDLDYGLDKDDVQSLIDELEELDRRLPKDAPSRGTFGV